MKTNRFLSLLFVMLLVQGCKLPSSAVPAKNIPLTLALSTNKSAYHLGESVWVTVILTNAGNEDLLVYGRLIFADQPVPDFMNLGSVLIRDNEGKQILRDTNANIEINWTPKMEDFVVLSPGSSLNRSFYLPVFDEHTQAGTYTISVVYRNSFDPKDVPDNPDDKREAWKGEITSNSEIVEIIP